VIVKLAPNVPSVTQIAHAVIEAGADALCAINTMPGLVIDAESGQPLLANISGGISGPALKPIAVKCVYDLHRAFPHVPIIGTGGVTTGKDAVEMIMAGATLVGVGSAIYYRGQHAISEIRAEFDHWLRQRGIKNLAEIRGSAHRAPIYSTVPTGAPIPHAH
jgi:dihydroorotate dehydrogenase (NAD+) catalytic subunit